MLNRLCRLAFVALTALATVSALTTAVRADEEAAKLETQGKALRYTQKTTDPVSRIDTGGAAIFVNAPIDAVRRIVTDYRHYSTMIKPFKQSKLLSRSKGVSEVYLEVPILHGAATVWVVAVIGPVVKENGEEKIIAKRKDGNVDDFRATWRLRAVDAEHTIVKLELLVDPKVPAPASAVANELSGAADKAVTAVRDQAKKGKAGEADKAAAQAPAPAATDGKQIDVAKR
jgi:ribosome-associated toxin RatA of RatAB toxin-antitoxin module